MRVTVLTALIFSFAMPVHPVLAQDKPQEKSINLSGSVTQYFLPEEGDITVPVAGVMINDFILELRHNYEAEDVTSIWLGKSFHFETLEAEILPMVAGIFGEIEGMAPGFKIDLSYKDFNLYSEGEYVFDFAGRDNNFFYSWSELTYYPLEWLRVGIAGQRTRLYDTDVEIDRGPLVGVEFAKITLSAAALNIDTKTLWVVSAEISWDIFS